jgi:hypothetical protein
MSKMTQEQRDMYEKFCMEFPYCMACGWHMSHKIRRRDWMLAKLDCAHILGGVSRVADRRDIVRLCNGCHRLNHHEAIRIDGECLPHLDTSHVLWIKQMRDTGYYDVGYLNEIKVGICPDPAEPPEWFTAQWETNSMDIR